MPSVQDWASVKDRKDRRIDDNLGDKSTLRIAPVFFLVFLILWKSSIFGNV